MNRFDFLNDEPPLPSVIRIRPRRVYPKQRSNGVVFWLVRVIIGGILGLAIGQYIAYRINGDRTLFKIVDSVTKDLGL